MKEGWPVDIFIRGKATEGVEAPLEEGQEIEKEVSPNLKRGGLAN